MTPDYRLERIVEKAILGVVKDVERLATQGKFVKEDFPPIMRKVPGMVETIEETTERLYHSGFVALTKVEAKYIARAKKVLE